MRLHKAGATASSVAAAVGAAANARRVSKGRHRLARSFGLGHASILLSHTLKILGCERLRISPCLLNRGLDHDAAGVSENGS